jgi:Spy/CpxP family protein refolding chaperone
LGLPQDKAGAIADRWALFDEDSFTRRQRMGQLRQQMNATLMGPGSEEDKNRKLQPVVEQLAGLRQQQQESRKRFEEDIQDRLTPAQQGRFILLVDEFQRSLQEAIRERRRDKLND